MKRKNLVSNIPNILTGFRLVLSPVLLLLAWFGSNRLFLYVVIIAFITDSIDGPIARLIHKESVAGSKMDTIADMAIYVTYMTGAWWLWPEIFRREQVYFLIIIASLLFPAASCIIKYHEITSYHTWLVKIAAVCIAVSSLLLFMFDMRLSFRIAAVLCLLAGIEEFTITLILKKPCANVKSAWHVLQKIKYK